MQIFVKTLIILWICTTSIQGECNVCQRSNFVVCHEENVYSLCINDIPTKDFITCPENHVCTDGPYVCYPRHQKEPSCTKNKNLCGVCSDNKVYACVNETTIAFCYGQDKPVEGADVSYCLGDTVCDIYSTKGFCTERYLVKPSCVTEIEDDMEGITTEVTNEPTTTTLPTTIISTTTTKEPTTTTTTIEPTTTEPTITTTTTELITTTTKETSTSTTTTEPTTTTATTEPTTTTTTTEPTSTSTTTTTTEPTTTSTTTTTTEPTTTTSTTTTESTTTTTTTETPPKPRDPNTICTDAGTTGSFYADDPTCTSFIVCYMMSGKIYGLKKACPSGQYFPPGADKCASNKPDICA